jgi:hypothetical protein
VLGENSKKQKRKKLGKKREKRVNSIGKKFRVKDKRREERACYKTHILKH